MQTAISSAGVPFGPAARVELEQLITQGVSQMMKRQEHSQPQRVVEAQQNLVQYISRIGQYANENNLSSVDILPAAVKLEFCPVYPFK